MYYVCVNIILNRKVVSIINIYKDIGIYRITNKLNGKSYIGKTGMNFGDRWDSHRSLLNYNKHDNPYLQAAWNKYGEDAFEFVVVEIVDSADVLNELEIRYIKEYKETGMSYNIHDGGDGGWNLGQHLSDETKRKIGEKNRVNMTGRKLSSETKAKMSESQTERYDKWSDEDRAAWGEMTSRTATGYKWSEESKAAFSELQRANPNGAKFTKEDILEIRFRAKNGEKHKDIAAAFNTTPAYVGSIVAKRRWANI